LDFGAVVYGEWDQLDPKRRCRGLDGSELADPGGRSGIPKDRDVQIRNHEPITSASDV
jgi:hypothetical protein